MAEGMGAEHLIDVDEKKETEALGEAELDPKLGMRDILEDEADWAVSQRVRIGCEA